MNRDSYMGKQPSFRKWILSGAVPAFVLLAAVADAADTNQPPKASADLENLSLEQLVNVQVTSVSKKETDAFHFTRRHLCDYARRHPTHGCHEHS